MSKTIEEYTFDEIQDIIMSMTGRDSYGNPRSRIVIQLLYYEYDLKEHIYQCSDEPGKGGLKKQIDIDDAAIQFPHRSDTSLDIALDFEIEYCESLRSLRELWSDYMNKVLNPDIIEDGVVKMVHIIPEVNLMLIPYDSGEPIAFVCNKADMLAQSEICRNKVLFHVEGQNIEFIVPEPFGEATT